MALSSEAPFGTLLASAVRTADTHSERMTNDARYPGLLLFFNCTLDAAAASHNIELEVLNPVTEVWSLYHDTSVAIDTVELKTVLWHRIGLASGSWNVSASGKFLVPIPMIWRLFMDVTDADAITYSVGYQYIN